MTLLTEQDIADAWDASPRHRPMAAQDNWDSTSFREFARGFAKLIEARVIARLKERKAAAAT